MEWFEFKNYDDFFKQNNKIRKVALIDKRGNLQYFRHILRIFK